MNEALGLMGSQRALLSAPLSSPPALDVPVLFERILGEHDLFAALHFLNSTTPYRFTGVYCFEPGLVKSVVLADRENPDVRVGADVPWFDSYCMMTSENGRECEIQDALSDVRLKVHAARQTVLSYCGVLLRGLEGEELGTLCHYDVCARQTPAGTFEGLRTCHDAVERYLWEHLSIRPPALPRE